MARPLLNIVCITEPGCKYPVGVRILMDNGKEKTYWLGQEQTPFFTRSKEIFEESLDISIGYQYTKPKRRNRIHRFQR